MGGIREIRRTFVLADKERRKYKWEREKKTHKKLSLILVPNILSKVLSLVKELGK